MADILKLDLDTIQPAKGEVTIGGKTYEIDSPDLAATISLYRVAQTFQSLKDSADADEIMAAIEQMLQAIDPFIPGLAEDKVKLTFTQATKLLELLIKMTVPPQTSAMQEAGIEVAEMSEKKIQSDS